MDKLSKKQLQAFLYIRDSIVHQGKSPSIRDLKKRLGYSSPNSAAFVIESLIRMGLVQRKPDKTLQIAKNLPVTQQGERTVEVPLVGLVPCGSPVISDENIEARIAVAEKLARPPYKYFLLRASGDSMDLAGINDGDLVLIRQQNVAKNSEFVVALIDGESTIKEFQKQKNVILLKPKSSNPKYKPIIMTSDFLIQGIVVTTISNM